MFYQVSNIHTRGVSTQGWEGDRKQKFAHLLFDSHVGPHGLDAVATLDYIGLEGNRARATVQLEKQAAGVAQDRAHLVASPERRGGCAAVLACGLRGFTVMISHGRHDCGLSVTRSWGTRRRGGMEEETRGGFGCD